MKKVSVEENDSRFPSFKQGFNQRWYANNCNVVYLCENADGTANALEDAISRFDKDVKVKCGGHCYENFVFNEVTKAILDVTSLDDAGYDEDRGYYLGAGGNNWEAFKSLFRDFGKVLPAGSCYSVGLGGHICGGGYGLLSRLNGLTVDWLTGVELVVKDKKDQPARTIYVSKESIGDEQDLFWAHCGGGGGNFGVITKYYFKNLPDSPECAFLTTYAFQWKHLSAKTLYKLLEWYEGFSLNNDNWNQFGLFKLNHKANGEIHLLIQTATENSDEALKRNKALIEKQSKELTEICEHRIARKPIFGNGAHVPSEMSTNTILYTYYEATQTLNGSGVNQRGKYKSAYMRKKFSKRDAKVIFNQLQKVPKGFPKTDMTQSLLQVDSYGGRINNVDSTATAIAQRDSIFKLQYQTYWTSEKDDPKYLSWIREFYGAVYKKTGGTPNPKLDPTNNVAGCYYNYPDADLNELVGKQEAMELYFLENLDRLKVVKRRWDPNNYFNNEQSIPLI